MKKNITLSIEAGELEKFQEVARERGTTVNALVRSYIQSEIKEEKGEGLERLFKLADELKLSTNGWKWNREEVYDRKGLR